jgi:hypothetical protein
MPDGVNDLRTFARDLGECAKFPIGKGAHGFWKAGCLFFILDKYFGRRTAAADALPQPIFVRGQEQELSLASMVLSRRGARDGEGGEARCP